MTQITNTSQLSTFSLIRTIILTNSTLSTKFNVNNILEFDPKLKSLNSPGFPHIIVNVPDVDDTEGYLGDYLRRKEFDVEIILRMGYEAKDNYTSYASNLITVLDASNSTLNASGYHLIKVNSDGKPELITINSKECLEGTFSLMLEGEVVV